MDEIRQKEYVNAIIETHGNKTEAYLKVNPGTDREKARFQASKVYTIHNIRQQIIEQLSKQADTNAIALTQSIREDLNAAKPFNAGHGKIIQCRDNATIWDVKKTLLKIYGVLSDEQLTIGTQNNIIMSDDAANRLAQSLDRSEQAQRQADTIEASIIEGDVIL